MLSDPTLIVIKVAAALEDLRVPYLIGGSVASSVYGPPRATQDIDLVADLQPGHVSPLVRALQAEFYVDADTVRDALRQRSSFNIIHLATATKVDVFIPKPGPWSREEFSRRRAHTIGTDDEAVTLYFASPEDTVLHKLAWYRAGGGVSDRQWGDVLGVLKVQDKVLDREYLRHWAAELGLTDLLERARDEAGVGP